MTATCGRGRDDFCRSCEAAGDTERRNVAAVACAHAWYILGFLLNTPCMCICTGVIAKLASLVVEEKHSLEIDAGRLYISFDLVYIVTPRLSVS